MNEDRQTELLHAYLDGELDAAETAAFQTEVARDPALRSELEALRAIDNALETLPGHMAPADFTDRVVAAAGKPRGLLVRLALPLAAAAALALAVFVPRGPDAVGTADPFTTEEHLDYVWETDAETFGSLSLDELEGQILRELESA